MRIGPKAHFGSFLTHWDRISEIPILLPSFCERSDSQDQTITVKQVDFFIGWLRAFDFSVSELLSDFCHFGTLDFWTLRCGSHSGCHK
ncbi:hypothetical protein KPMX200_130030 [Klebsiella pneumoniae]|nr:hypothetical protein KPMX200_130030 [Klebsiella pneumoniae]